MNAGATSDDRRLRTGFRTGKDLTSDRGNLLLAKGSALSARQLESLLEKGYSSVTIDDPDTEGIEIPDVVSDSVKAATRAKLSSTFDMFTDVSTTFVGEDPKTIDKALDSGEVQRTAEAIDPVERHRGEVEAMLDEILTADTLYGLNAIMIHDGYSFSTRSTWRL
ncbi:MAG TPA: hypothetical protein QGG37_10580 [Chloroflexota bacterium]|nr:hypothetical protein [Chloroflexota bacterium]